MEKLQRLMHALDDWESADDRANEAAAMLSGPAPLAREDVEGIRLLQRAAAQKLEALRLLVADEVEPSGF